MVGTGRPFRLKPKAMELKKDSLTRFVRRHRDRYADEITPQDINAFLQAISKGTEQTATRPLSNRTVNIHISNVRTMYNWALKQGMVTTNPTSVTQKLPEGEGRTRILTPDEVDDLLGACRDPVFRDMLDIYLNTGLRSTELSTLTWADVDLENRRFTVRRVKTENTAKTTTIQHLPLNQEALRAFARQPHRGGHIFLDNAGKPFEQNRIGQRMRRLRVRAGLTCDVTVHVLRHTFASNLAVRGVPIQSIAVLLGHKRAEPFFLLDALASDAVEIQQTAVAGIRATRLSSPGVVAALEAAEKSPDLGVSGLATAALWAIRRAKG